MIRDKKGDITGIFVFMIIAFIIVVFSGIFIYMSNVTEDKLKATLGGMDFHTVNGTNATIEETFGQVNVSFGALYWLSVMEIVGMMVAILINCYLVRTRPIFFIPYIFGLFIAIIVAVALSNAYETITQNATLSSTYANFVGANFLLLNLPLIITIIGFLGAILMFSQVGRRDEQLYYG